IHTHEKSITSTIARLDRFHRALRHEPNLLPLITLDQKINGSSIKEAPWMATVKITCPKCGFENPFGSLVCGKCDTPLIKLESPDGPNTTLTTTFTIPETSGPSIPQPVKDVPALSANSIAFYIQGTFKPLILEIKQQAILGRANSDGTIQPQIDLTPYGAYEKGISRRHAVIRRTPTGLVIEDLGSSNGTSLNGQRLQPFVPAPLKPNDHVKLGGLEMMLYFP